MAVNTVATMCVAYHPFVPEEAAAQPEIAPAMVMTWRRIKKRPGREGQRRRARVRKMQLEAAERRM